MSVFHKNAITYSYTLHGSPLAKVSKAKYLGVTITSNLSWSLHIDNITAKANRTLGMLRRDLRIASVEAKQRAYMALVRSTLEYPCPVWDPHTAEQSYQNISEPSLTVVLASTRAYQNISEPPLSSYAM
ncbi:hypothetical protein Bbelb_217960 [Branchiostoma belcheri]|nr:hypothetical protein Bbelb_217960 [Branchiostoma belcheri]